MTTINEKDLPQYFRKHVFVCTNQRQEGHPRGCCKSKGSIETLDYMKKRAKEMGLDDVRINSSGCLDRCEIGPTMVVYPEGVWYRCENHEDIDAVLVEHLQADGRVERLMLQPED